MIIIIFMFAHASVLSFCACPSQLSIKVKWRKFMIVINFIVVSKMDLVETNLCDYLQVRHAKMESSATLLEPSSPSKPGSPQHTPSRQSSPSIPSKFYKHWTSLWVVLNIEISPNYSYIGYCKKESDWLIDSQTIAKCYLDETFKVARPPAGYSKKYENVIQLIFKGYRLDLGFDSMTKLDQWYKALQVASERHHVDLVRCHEHPELEREYVVQVCPSFYCVWNPSVKHSPAWEWQLKHIRRVHWHKNVNKLEVEPGRSSQTGEGHFFFTGQHAYRLFHSMKQMMSTHSSPTPLSPSSRRSETSTLVQVNGEREGGSAGGSESDWTGGTGDDWTGTGTSSDSAFINYIRSQHQHGDRFGLLGGGATPSPPLPPLRRTSDRSAEETYANINPMTLNQDNQYCTINQLTQNNSRHTPNTATPTHVQTPPPKNLVDSYSTDDDEYCKMVPNVASRAGLRGPNAPPSPLPKREGTRPLA